MNVKTNTWMSMSKGRIDQYLFGENHTFFSGFSSHDPPKSFQEAFSNLHRKNSCIVFLMILYLLLVEQQVIMTDVYWGLTLVVLTTQITSLALPYILQPYEGCFIISIYR